MTTRAIDLATDAACKAMTATRTQVAIVTGAAALIGACVAILTTTRSTK